MLLLLPFLGKTQVNTIPQKSNTILIKGVTFQEVCNKLLDSGYVIEKKDNDLQTIRTEFKEYPKSYNAAYKISVRVKDSIAFMTVNFTAPYDQWLTKAANKIDPLWNNERSYYQENKKGKVYSKNIYVQPFLWINLLALSFGKPVEYKIQ